MTLSNKSLDMNGSITQVFCPKKPYGPDLDLTNTTFFFNNSSSDDRIVDPSLKLIDNPYFNHQTVPLFLIVVLPMISLKSPTIFTKFNSVGTINVFFLIGLVIFLGASWGINADFEHEDSVVFTPMYKDSFPSLSGMMALGLFIHNAIITIMKNNKYQENNVSSLYETRHDSLLRAGQRGAVLRHRPFKTITRLTSFLEKRFGCWFHLSQWDLLDHWCHIFFNLSHGQRMH